jgi:aspartate/methionine/tyrosine aminotransferase
MVVKLRQRRDYSHDRIRQIEGLHCNNPQGAFYIFPKIDMEGFNKWKDDKEFTIDLLKTTGVCGVYGSGFGEYGKDHIRFTFLPDLETLETVYDKLEDFVK